MKEEEEEVSRASLTRPTYRCRGLGWHTFTLRGYNVARLWLLLFFLLFSATPLPTVAHCCPLLPTPVAYCCCCRLD